MGAFTRHGVSSGGEPRGRSRYAAPMRWFSLLFALPLVACSGEGGATPRTEGAAGADSPADVANSDSNAEPLAAPDEPAAMRSIRLTLPSSAAKGTSVIVFLGFDPETVSGNWAEEGERPRHHTVTKAVALAETVEMDVSLHGGLTYFALIDLDENAVPTDGEGVSGPVTVSGDTSAAPDPFVFKLTWGAPGSGLGVPQGAAESPLGGAVDVAVEGEELSAPPVEAVAGDAVTRAIRLDSDLKGGSIESARVLIVGMPSSGSEAYVGPLTRESSYVWASAQIMVTWPLKLDAQFPAGGDVQVLLDVDGDLLPSIGDLASAPFVNFEPVPEGSSMDVTLVHSLGQERKDDEKEPEQLGELPGENKQIGEVPREGEQLGEPVLDEN